MAGPSPTMRRSSPASIAAGPDDAVSAARKVAIERSTETGSTPGAEAPFRCRPIAPATRPPARSGSATTRPPRAGEKNGVDYWFHSREEFDRLVREGGFVEWAQVFDHFYATPRGSLELAAADGLDAFVARLSALDGQPLWSVPVAPSTSLLAVRGTDVVTGGGGGYGGSEGSSRADPG